MNVAESDLVLRWYSENGRDLAFRRTADPWAILVSEVMAQQTQAARAAEAWTRFMALFPTATALAAASPADVVRAWRGLGYNRRALALRQAAITIVEEHGGRVPSTPEALIALPGIGPYTARAVMAIAFGLPVAALDVNIRRVLGRAFLPGSIAKRDVQAAADGLVPIDRAADWTHALMDIGATVCRPREPRCDGCPLQATCRFARAQVGPGEKARTPGLSRSKAPRFETTSRWLRGRIVDRLRDAPDGAWITFEEAIGEHDRATVEAAIAALASEGQIEALGDQARLATA